MTLAELAWRGPRPLGPKDRLVGRDKELVELMQAVQSRRVVELTARSGVGKTSFLTVARGALERRLGVRVMTPGDGWADVLTTFRETSDAGWTPLESAAALYATALGAPEREPEKVFQWLQELAPDRPVVVFDQLEELLRYQRGLGVEFLTFVGRANRAHHVPHVVSARSEYSDLLRAVEQRNVLVWDLPLRELTDAAVLAAIVEQPAMDAGVELQDGVSATIVGWWQEARTGGLGSLEDADPARGQPEIGLLHLQALLWLFQRWAVATLGPETTKLTTDDVGAFEASRGQGPGSSNAGGELVASALVEYVGHVTEHLLRLPREWVFGPTLMFARVARFLSSAGFKVPQALSSLLSQALQAELSPQDSRSLSRLSLVDPEAIATAFPLDAAGKAKALVWEGQRVTEEAVGSLIDALDEMTKPKVNILRGFKYRAGGDVIYELVHDGVGAALNTWSESVLEDPAAVIGVITVRSGLPLVRREGLEEGEPDFGPAVFLEGGERVGEKWGDVHLADDGRVRLGRLVWLGNIVRKCIFQNVVFDRCTFTGTAFLECTFDEVTFEGCDLNGVVMKDCHLADVVFCGSGDAKPAHSMDTLTFTASTADGPVTFVGLEEVTSLFFLPVAGGPWRLEDCAVGHVGVTSMGDQAVPFVIAGGTVVHLSVDEGVQPIPDRHPDVISMTSADGRLLPWPPPGAAR